MTRREFVRTASLGIALLPLFHHKPWHKPRPGAGRPMGLLLALTYA